MCLDLCKGAWAGATWSLSTPAKRFNEANIPEVDSGAEAHAREDSQTPSR
jgi:hypothetical protein